MVRDDQSQADDAAALLKDAEVIAVSLPCLCEFVWVLRSFYGFGKDDISAAVEALAATGNVAVDRPVVDAGLALLKAGGDFADGLIAYEGAWLGAETFVAFDKRAVSLIAKQGLEARWLTDAGAVLRA